jgi:ABC-2 type transport system permease protein
MTTLQESPRHGGPAVSRGPRAPVAGLLRAEWTKIRSVRSTVWSLLAFVVATIGFSTLVASVVSGTWNQPGNDHTELLTDPTAVVFGPGLLLGQLALAVLGVMVITGEYSTGAIRSSLLAVPGRLGMLAAKLAVFATLALGVAAVSIVVTFFIATAILGSHITITLGQTGVLRATLGAVLYLVVVGLFALAIGGLIRHTAGAIATVIGLILVIPPLIGLIPGSVAAHVQAYFFANAGRLIAQTSQQPGDLLSPWQGFGVFCLETAVLLAAAGWLLKRRDA